MKNLRQKLGESEVPVVREVVLTSRMLLAQRATDFRIEARPGEYGSPIPDLKDVRRREGAIFRAERTIPGIELREAEQLALVGDLGALYADQPYEPGRHRGLRYFPQNEFFGEGAAFVLHAMLRRLRPRRLIEVGSGFSSAVILDTNDLFLDRTLRSTFIDPFPERLNTLLRPGDEATANVITSPIQDVPIELFDELGDGDVLFIDSTHVSKVGSDVNTLLFDVLPRLRPGVVIHVHDIYFPFEYPKEWIYKGRAWNENYLLRSFLMYNQQFEILLFNSYLDRFHREEIAATMPRWGANVGTSFWMRRIGHPGTGG